MKTIDLAHPHNEISGILGVQNPELLEAFGFRMGFWIISDERDATEAVALLGRPEGGEWRVIPFSPTLAPGSSGKATEDAESIARAGAWVYVFGSQYGKKKGPVAPKRHFVTRFNESLLRREGDAIQGELLSVRRPFLLHRLLNDAVREAGVELLGAPGLEATHITPAVERGEKKAKRWRSLVRPDDAPINLEGATFLPGGHLLLGLRFPVTTGGHPLLIELEGIDRFFHADLAPPRVIAVRILENVGSRREPAGIRELDCDGDTLHVVTGNLDSKPEKSAILQHVKRAERARCIHWQLPLVEGSNQPTVLRAQRARTLDPNGAIEGIAFDHGLVWYAHDAEHIRIDVAPSVKP